VVGLVCRPCGAEKRMEQQGLELDTRRVSTAGVAGGGSEGHMLSGTCVAPCIKYSPIVNNSLDLGTLWY
jgi:hypothetical protein